MNRFSRRGGVYILVLAGATMLAMAGLCVAALTRIQIRSDTAAQDTDRASDLALSGIHAALGYFSLNENWRVQAAGGSDQGELTLSTGTAKWWIRDSAGGTVSTDPLRPIQIFGLGTTTSNRSRRLYRVTAQPPPVVGLDALRCVVHSNNVVKLVQGSCTLGPISSNSTVNVTGTFLGNIEAVNFVNSGIFSGTLTTPAAAKGMPVPSTVLTSKATSILFSLTGGRLERCVLSPGSNPYGLANVEGIYSISVPSGATLELRNMRLCATLLVTLGANSTLDLNSTLLWQPGNVGLPTLVVNGDSSARVLLRARSDQTLSESGQGVNFNPVGSPYAGETDLDMTDSYASQIEGVIDIQDPIPTTVSNRQKIVGCLISQGTVEINDATLAADPMLKVSPPLGYTGVEPYMVIERGSWTWVSVEQTPIP